MKKSRWSKYLVLILAVCLLLNAFPATPAGAYDPGELRKMFDKLDTVNNGNWHKDANNDNSQLAWGESYVLDAYVTMYEATGDTYYLDKFVTHGKGVLAQRDSTRGVKDYRGLSLPAWRNGKYTTNGEYAIFAVHTGMIVYPMAKFAAIVAGNPALGKYAGEKDLFLQAAKDAIAVHRDEWVDKGDTGYYKFPEGMPYKQAGMGLPFNQYLSMARAELMIYRAGGEAQYLDRARKMLQHFKNNLAVDESINGYTWRYSAFYSSSYEDIGHAKTDVDAAFQGYNAGLVFNSEDMARLANNAARKIIKPDGNIASNILGQGTLEYPWMIGFWCAYGQFQPVITETSYKKLSAMSYGGPTGLLAAAMLNKANSSPGYRGGGSLPEPPVDNPPPAENPPQAGEMVKNGDFSQGATGWSGPDVVVKAEANGNKYGSAKYGWNFYQYVPVQPGGKYTITARSRKGNAASEARIAYFFYDAAGKQLSSGSILYKHKGIGWEQVPAQTLTAPAGAASVLIKLLVNGGSGTHDFDDISLKLVGSPAPPVNDPPPADNDPPAENPPPAGNNPPSENPPADNPPASAELVENGGFSQGQAGWSGPDVVVKTEANGNKYGSAKYGWNFYQYVPVQPGAKYNISARSRKGNAASEARIAYFFYDAAGKQLSSGSVLHKHKGTGWEQVPAQTLTAPAGAVRVLIKLLVNGGSGTHDFDDISLKRS